MKLREYQPSDIKEIAELFYITVHTVNAKDYTAAQLNAWAPKEIDFDAWNKTLCERNALVAIENDIIIGFGDIDKSGYLDRLYVRADYQGMGIATALLDELERLVNGDIVTHASITARPFFEKRGYRVMKKQSVLRRGVELSNFIMIKSHQI